MNTRTYYDGNGSELEVTPLDESIEFAIGDAACVYLNKEDLVNLIEYLQILNKDLI